MASHFFSSFEGQALVLMSHATIINSMSKQRTPQAKQNPWYWLLAAFILLVVIVSFLILTDAGQRIGTRPDITPLEVTGACYAGEATCINTTEKKCIARGGGSENEADAVYAWFDDASCPPDNACMPNGATTLKVFSQPYTCKDPIAEADAFFQCEDEQYALGKIARLCRAKGQCTAELLHPSREHEVVKTAGNIKNCQAVCLVPHICNPVPKPTTSSLNDADPTTKPTAKP